MSHNEAVEPKMVVIGSSYTDWLNIVPVGGVYLIKVVFWQEGYSIIISDEILVIGGFAYWENYPTPSIIGTPSLSSGVSVSTSKVKSISCSMGCWFVTFCGYSSSNPCNRRDRLKGFSAIPTGKTLYKVF